jgi:hypothetical protein
MTSGRLTPAASTLTRISPSPGCGTSASGPPGDFMAMAVMVAGMDGGTEVMGLGFRLRGDCGVELMVV